jgi:hypothetical protein
MVIVAGWVLAAVLAVLVGVVGIGIVGAGLTSRQGAPISQEDVLRALGESAAPAPSIAETSEPPAPAAQSFTTRGGIVVATCEKITAMSPAQGFQVHEQNAAEGEFRGIRDNHNRVKVQLTCPNGRPELRTRDES